MKSKDIFRAALLDVGVAIDGSNPWDIQLHNPNLFDLLVSKGSLGLGEAYMDGWWDCQQLDEFFFRILSNHLEQKVARHTSWRHKLGYMLPRWLLNNMFNPESIKRSPEVARRHYDLGNDLFTRMLDSSMNYSCGYWKNSDTLEDAQQEKMSLVCRKLQLRPRMRVLDIGCGWGGLAKYAAENYGVDVVGVTLSGEQKRYADEHYGDLPIDIRVQDYRELNERFDRIVSIGMFEHVGLKNYRVFMQTARNCLVDDGLCLLHTIGDNITTRFVDPWIKTYIFPVGFIPSVLHIAKAYEGLLVMEDWHNFGADYDKTLMAWRERFVSHWDDIKDHYDEKFYRMWNYYLLSCAGAFRARDIQTWQIVFSKEGIAEGYHSVR